MNIDNLFDQLEGLKEMARHQEMEVRAKLTKALEAQYKDWKALQETIGKLEAHEGVEYTSNWDGISSYIRFDLSDVPEREREYLEGYLMDRGITVDWDNGVLLQYQGDDNIIIQDDTRRDNGVWQGHKLIIDESEYKDEDGDVDEDKRNELIEAHMEKTGYFPGVFRVTQHGGVFPVNTIKNGETK